jgi:SH3-like domain-containing protein
VLQQLGGLWRRLKDQSPARQALILATPLVAAVLLVLGGLIVWSVAAPIVTPRPTVVVQASPMAVPPTSELVVIATASPTAVAVLPTVVVPAREPTSTPPSPPTITTTPEPTRTPTPEPARSARIVNTEGQGANMRRAPSVSAQRIKLVVEGTVVELIGGEQRGDGYTWRNVRDVDGATGYVITDYLQPIQGPPGATPVLPPPSIRVEDITSPVARGGEATLKIITRPGVRCELRVLLFGPATLPREGLETKTADSDGVCSWTWTVPEDVVPGTWRYRISAGEGEGRATREVPVVVT